jgi:hypothetical protein
MTMTMTMKMRKFNKTSIMIKVEERWITPSKIRMIIINLRKIINNQKYRRVNKWKNNRYKTIIKEELNL